MKIHSKMGLINAVVVAMETTAKKSCWGERAWAGEEGAGGEGRMRRGRGRGGGEERVL